ncbi:MAG: ABC transporter substrate-binding protein [Gallionellaceae bacterium]|nr:ABC transporter substrate-binding protein [Gallionellaceae bacterium]
MSRRVFLSHLISLPALAAAPWLFGCSQPHPFVAGIHPWIGYETLNLAREFRWLPAGVHFRDGKDTSDTLAALNIGELDAACLTLDETLVARTMGVPLTAVLVFDVSAGSDMVLARPPIKNLADLAGKRLGVEQSTVGELVLEKLLEAAKLPASALTLVNLPVGQQQIDAWQSNEVDVIITYEPVASKLLHLGALRLFDSRQMPDTILDVFAVRIDRAQSHKAALKALIAAHFRALAHLQANREDAIYRIAAHQKISVDDVRRALSGVMLPSLVANHEYLSSKEGKLIQAANEISRLMVRQGRLQRNDALDGLISPDWLPPYEG